MSENPSEMRRLWLDLAAPEGAFRPLGSRLG
jgi:hypothetical protein